VRETTRPNETTQQTCVLDFRGCRLTLQCRLQLDGPHVTLLANLPPGFLSLKIGTRLRAELPDGTVLNDTRVVTAFPLAGLDTEVITLKLNKTMTKTGAIQEGSTPSIHETGPCDQVDPQTGEPVRKGEKVTQEPSVEQEVSKDS